ncbi:DegT/DnrJ/EryC1/StrS family aminotransferase [Candidatus Acetothermia bacterium]|nr:DegT/DnrJ/EryC1/StrS family aminotransferase [Candidatus Acetothermia bacterium]MBI3643974.1 DegT/DnrJ/EryC1/StrS family aminotransferase [Candidatus Acetothermia bacterium]
MKMIPLARPDIGPKEIEYVTAVLKSPYLSLGPRLPEFEEKIARYAGVRYAVAVNSGTSALHLMVKALGIGQGDEVITTPFSFVASANCMLFEGAKPVFVDIEPSTYNIDVSKIEAAITPKTKAILAVDVFGQPANWDAITKIAKKHRLLLIEDSAEAIGSEYKNRKAGCFGDVGVFAFYPNKQMTTGEGGVILTDREEIAKLCRSYRNQGRGEAGTWLQHERIGYNFRLSDINCALGLAQLERIEELQEKRDRVAQLYFKRLKAIKDLYPPCIAPDVKVRWFVYVIRLADRFTKTDREEIQEGLRDRGIENRNYFSPIHLQPFYQAQFGWKRGDFPVTEHVSDRTIALPFFNQLSEKEIDYVGSQLEQLLR